MTTYIDCTVVGVLTGDAVGIFSLYIKGSMSPINSWTKLLKPVNRAVIIRRFSQRKPIQAKKHAHE